MSDNKKKNNKPDNVEMIPTSEDITTVTEGKCDSCGHDMNELLRRVEKGEVSLPRFCRGCGKQIQGTTTVEIYICTHCKEVLARIDPPDPKNFNHCPGCGESLDYSDIQPHTLPVTSPTKD